LFDPFCNPCLADPYSCLPGGFIGIGGPPKEVRKFPWPVFLGLFNSPWRLWGVTNEHMQCSSINTKPNYATCEYGCINDLDPEVINVALVKFSYPYVVSKCGALAANGCPGSLKVVVPTLWVLGIGFSRDPQIVSCFP